MRVTADFSGSPEECQEFLDRVKGTSLPELPLPGSTIAGRRVLAVEKVNPKFHMQLLKGLQSIEAFKKLKYGDMIIVLGREDGDG